MNAKYFLPLVFPLILGNPLWADSTNPFQGQTPQQTPGQSQPPQPAPPVVNMQSQAVQVYTLPDGRYHAELNYQEKADDTRKYTFEGSKEEIHQQLDQSGLPDERKQTVLRSLENNPADLFGSVFGGSLFNEPDFQQFFNGFPRLQQELNDPVIQQFFQSIPQLQQQLGDPAFQNDPFGDDFFNKFLQGLPQLQTQPGTGQLPPQSLPFPEIQPPAPVKPAFPAQSGGKTEWL